MGFNTMSKGAASAIWKDLKMRGVLGKDGKLVGKVSVDTAEEIFRDMGAKVKGFYLLMGHYDMVFIVEAPNYETVAKAALTLDSLGNMRTETLRAFTEDEYRKIIADIP